MICVVIVTIGTAYLRYVKKVRPSDRIRARGMSRLYGGTARRWHGKKGRLTVAPRVSLQYVRMVRKYCAMAQYARKRSDGIPYDKCDSKDQTELSASIALSGSSKGYGESNGIRNNMCGLSRVCSNKYLHGKRYRIYNKPKHWGKCEGEIHGSRRECTGGLRTDAGECVQHGSRGKHCKCKGEENCAPCVGNGNDSSKIMKTLAGHKNKSGLCTDDDYDLEEKIGDYRRKNTERKERNAKMYHEDHGRTRINCNPANSRKQEKAKAMVRKADCGWLKKDGGKKEK